MIACTSPRGTVRLSPRTISRSAISTRRFWMLSSFIKRGNKTIPRFVSFANGDLRETATQFPPRKRDHLGESAPNCRGWGFHFEMNGTLDAPGEGDGTRGRDERTRRPRRGA